MVGSIKHRVLFVVFICLGSIVYASNNDTLARREHSENIYQMEAGYYLNHLDSFVINTYYKSMVIGQGLNNSHDSTVYKPPINRDSTYAPRMVILDNKSPFELTYNGYVGAFIDLYVYKKRRLTENCLALSEYYFPVFEELLDKHDLPMEFKYLAVVESVLNIKARSRAGAAGLWQFMYRTGKQYGLEVNSYVDERYELYESTEAACLFFKDLYKIYGNWELVIAAYNCGPGNVNKAIRRAGGKRNFWEIRPYLPRETRGYVPAFMAVNYAMNYSAEHNLKAVYPDSLNLITDTISVNGPLSLHELAEYFCTDSRQLEYLNPSYKKGFVPDDHKKYVVRLPIGTMNAYLVYRDGFSSYLKAKEEVKSNVSSTQVVTSASRNSEEERIHTVKDGEVLGMIAEKYGCNVRQIQDWNNLYSSRIYAGQKLKIYSDKKIAKPVVAEEVKYTGNIKSEKKDYDYYTIKPGDTLWDIAKKYDGLTVTELKRLNHGLNHKKLKPGDRIIISAKS